MKKAAFYIDGGTGYYYGYTNGMTWNGWHTPWFTKAAIKRILATEQFEGVEFVWLDDLLIEHHNDDTPRRFVPSITHDGKTLYALGDGWCWDTEEIIETI